jgi:hypothetical protein
VNDGAGRLLLGVFAQEIFVHPKSDWMVVNCSQNGAFRTRSRLLYFCGHKKKGFASKAYKERRWFARLELQKVVEKRLSNGVELMIG